LRSKRARIHPHERASARPGKQIVSCGNYESLVGQLAIYIGEKRVLAVACFTAVRGDELLVRDRDRGPQRENQYAEATGYWRLNLATDCHTEWATPRTPIVEIL
jgi:hypothetical protein